MFTSGANIAVFRVLKHVSGTLPILAATVMPLNGRAASASVYVEQIFCEGGSFGLRLPSRLPAVMALGAIVQKDEIEVEMWNGYATTKTYIEFPGLILSLITFSNDSDRYKVSFAEITGPRWSHIAPFRVGESVKSVRGKLGLKAASDLELNATYGSEAGDIRFQSVDGKVRKITYRCYTG